MLVTNQSSTSINMNVNENRSEAVDFDCGEDETVKIVSFSGSKVNGRSPWSCLLLCAWQDAEKGVQLRDGWINGREPPLVKSDVASFSVRRHPVGIDEVLYEWKGECSTAMDLNQLDE